MSAVSTLKKLGVAVSPFVLAFAANAQTLPGLDGPITVGTPGTTCTSGCNPPVIIGDETTPTQTQTQQQQQAAIAAAKAKAEANAVSNSKAQVGDISVGGSSSALTVEKGAVDIKGATIEKGAIANTVDVKGATIEKGAIANTVEGAKIEKGAVAVTTAGGAGGAATIEKGAVDVKGATIEKGAIANTVEGAKIEKGAVDASSAASIASDAVKVEQNAGPVTQNAGDQIVNFEGTKEAANAGTTIMTNTVQCGKGISGNVGTRGLTAGGGYQWTDVKCAERIAVVNRPAEVFVTAVNNGLDELAAVGLDAMANQSAPLKEAIDHPREGLSRLFKRPAAPPPAAGLQIGGDGYMSGRTPIAPEVKCGPGTRLNTATMACERN